MIDAQNFDPIVLHAIHSDIGERCEYQFACAGDTAIPAAVGEYLQSHAAVVNCLCNAQSDCRIVLPDTESDALGS